MGWTPWVLARLICHLSNGDLMSETPHSNRWMRLALIGSLALNLLIIGIFIGASFRDPGPDRRTRGPGAPGPGGAVPGDLRSLAFAMPDAPRAALRAELESRPGKFREGRKRVNETRARFVAALEAEPFDITAIQAIFTEQADNFSKITKEGQAVLLQTIDMMSEDERKIFAKNLKDRRPKPRR